MPTAVPARSSGPIWAAVRRGPLPPAPALAPPPERRSVAINGQMWLTVRRKDTRRQTVRLKIALRQTVRLRSALRQTVRRTAHLPAGCSRRAARVSVAAHGRALEAAACEWVAAVAEASAVVAG